MVEARGLIPNQGRTPGPIHCEDDMPSFNAQKELDKRKREAVDPGEIPQSVIDELVEAKGNAKAYAEAFGDAVKAQAEKYKIKKGALSKYIAAIEADKVEDVRAETAALADLIG